MFKKLIVSFLFFKLILFSFSETYKFDFGSKESPLENGFIKITKDTKYDEKIAYGWKGNVNSEVVRDNYLNPFYHKAEERDSFYNLYCDGIVPRSDIPFLFKVIPGKYKITIIIGDLSPGESRFGFNIFVNEKEIIKNESTDGGTLKIYTFSIDSEDKIEIKLKSENQLPYISGIICEKTDKDIPIQIKVIPEKVTEDDYRKNWERFEKNFISDWQIAKEELKKEGVDFEYWDKKFERIKKKYRNYREYFPSGGLGRIDRLIEKAKDINTEKIVNCFKEIGIDGFVGGNDRYPASINEIRKHGLKYAVSGHAENIRLNEKVTLNLIRKKNGEFFTIKNVWSNCCPEAIRILNDEWKEIYKETGKNAEFFMIDEPRGCWYSGGIGDYSETAKREFINYLKEIGKNDIAEKVKENGIPEPSYSWDFYYFYIFRLNTVPLLVKKAIKDTPLEKIPVMPGNGDIGPETMNHSCYFPVYIAKNNFISASWSYNLPSSSKAAAETIKIAEEYNGKSYIWPPIYLGPPEKDLTTTISAISALNDKVCPWSFSKLMDLKERIGWLKMVYYSSRLTHATTILKHTPPVYIWLPASIVFNDLVNYDNEESGRWKEIYEYLFKINIDYGITNNFKNIEKDIPVLYAPKRPVLNCEEFEDLKNFLNKGGKIFYTFDEIPVYPDGEKIKEWENLQRENLIKIKLDKIKENLKFLNLQLDNEKIKTYIYRDENGEIYHLLNNTDYQNDIEIILNIEGIDFFTDKIYKKGDKLKILKGNYILLKENLTE